MKNEVPGVCPICSNKLTVQKVYCKECGISIEGDFQLCKFCLLTKEQKEFAEIFIKNKGNIKEIEKEMGISYPTVKNKLENLIEALGYKVKPKDESYRKNVLQRLYDGEITAEEAIQLLNE